MIPIFQKLITCQARAILQKCLLVIIISMQNCNRIIIPVVRNRPTHEELNVFQPSELCLTPTKDAPISRALVDRKWGSAFKKYKLKKEKKIENQDPGSQQLPTCTAIMPQRPLKIKIINVEAEAINKTKFHIQDLLPPIVFYDPNQAPLYWQNSGQYCLQENTQRSNPAKTQRMDEQLQIQVQQKIKKEPMEEEFQLKYVEVPANQSDPFIILKRVTLKKNKAPRSETNLAKTKIIKKSLPNSEKKIKAKIENIDFLTQQKRANSQMQQIEEKQENLNIGSPIFQASITRIMASQSQKMNPMGEYLAKFTIFLNSADSKYSINNGNISPCMMASEEIIR